MWNRIKKCLGDSDYQGVVSLLKNITPKKTSDRLAEIYCICLRKMGQEEKALAFLSEVIGKKFHKYPRSIRLIARILCINKQYDEARAILQKAYESRPNQHWYLISIGDIYYYHQGDKEGALNVYLSGLNLGKENLRPDILSIYRYLLKRISHTLFELDRYQDAIQYFEEFKRIEPSNFYETDFVLLGKCYEKTSRTIDAIEILKEGIRRRKGNKCLVELQRIAPKEALKTSLKAPLTSKPGALKIAVKTKIITEEDNAWSVINDSVKNIAKPDDIITFASAVAAITQARIFQGQAILPSWIANILSYFVTSSSRNAFATTSPLANPLSFQVAIEIVGIMRILFATFCGAFGKLLRKKGWFYMIAGPEVAMIDDMPASMAPYDYYIIPGPYDSDRLAQKIKMEVGFEVAIVDANDLGLAWVVGASNGVDKKEIEQYMADNPAGNEDDQTPIIIVRREKANV